MYLAKMRVAAILFLFSGLSSWSQPAQLPGTVQAEDYDSGGEGIAYHDLDAGNQGGAYRSDGVDIEHDGEGDYAVAYVEDGEWLRYTVEATNGFFATLRYRVASDWSGPSAARLSLDESTIDVVNLYDTGGWQSWSNHLSARPLWIGQGVHTLRVDFIIGGVNLDEVEVAAWTNEIPVYLQAAAPVTSRVEDLLARMTLGEKLGQLCLAGIEYLGDPGHEERDIATHGLGALLNGGDGGAPVNTPQGWADMVDRYQGYALATRLHIPMLYGIDAVHGHNNVYGATIFPHNIGLGAAGEQAIVEQAAQVTAVEMAATGIRWTFAPVVAVPRDERWGRFYEGFAETPERVGRLGAAAVRGFQGSDLSPATSVLACVKHYAGDGGTAWGTGWGGRIDRGNTVLDEAAFRALHLAAYTQSVAAGVGSVMASYSSWNGELMHGHSNLLTQVLKGELGFDGFVVSDWMGIDPLSGDYGEAIESAVLAGIDLVMVPDRYLTFLSLLQDRVTNGPISVDRVDDAVRRILRAKVQLGLFERPFAERALLPLVGGAAHRQAARDAVRRSLVVLKNEDGLLPLRPDLARVHVAGRMADNLGYQCGGWTISWQGGSGDTTIGTTLLEGITNAVSSGTMVTFSLDGTGASGADAGIVVVGETPYAEYEGDKADLSLDPADLAAIDNVRAAGVPVAVIVITGRPLILGAGWTNWEAVVAAWLPGTEGQGVADVLFGDFYPRARLPHSWPETMAQVPLNAGDTNYAPLFAFGDGLCLEPAVEAIATESGLSLAWPANHRDFRLQAAHEIAGAAEWNDLPGVPVLTDTLYRLDLPPPSATQQFYRLSRP